METFPGSHLDHDLKKVLIAAAVCLWLFHARKEGQNDFLLTHKHEHFAVHTVQVAWALCAGPKMSETLDSLH